MQLLNNWQNPKKVFANFLMTNPISVKGADYEKIKRHVGLLNNKKFLRPIVGNEKSLEDRH